MLSVDKTARGMASCACDSSIAASAEPAARTEVMCKSTFLQGAALIHEETKGLGTWLALGVYGLLCKLVIEAGELFRNGTKP